MRKMVKRKTSKTYKPKGSKNILFQPSQNGCLLLDKKNDRIHSLNTTAAFIWTFCDGKHSVVEIETALERYWKPSSKKVKDEVKKAIKKFKSLALLKT